MESLADVGLLTVQRFKLLEEAKPLESVTSQIQEWPADLFRAQFDRFELWAVNLGLFVMGHGSLDYRIRDSESMRESIYKMIQNLNRSLDEVLDYVNGNTDQGDEDSDTDSEPESDIDLLLGSIKDPIDRLYKLAVWIRNPATRLASSKARNFKQIDEYSNIDLFDSYKNHDYDYVSSLFLEYEKHRSMQESTPVECKDKASVGGDGEVDSSDHVWEPIRGVLSLYKAKVSKGAESYLVQRIARANGRRRQQFAYWKKHKDKLREHASNFVEAPTRQLIDEENNINAHTGETKTPLSVTTATQLRLEQAAGQEILEREGVLKLDVSEYAPSAWNPSKDTVSFPLPPKVSTSDNFFECPYCFTICPISLLSEKAWRAHMIRDLRPYVCTYEQCLNSEQLYDTRDDWIQHEMSTHQRIFRCFEHEEEIFTTLAAYEGHVQACHEHNVVSAKFATSTLKNVHRSCPVCSVALGSMQKLQSHIALHLERFAMFSLPRHTDGSEESETGSNVFTDHSENEESFKIDLDPESNGADESRDNRPRTLTNISSGTPLGFTEDESSDGDRKVLHCAVSGCGKTFKSSKNLAYHKATDHEIYKKELFCEVCIGTGSKTDTFYADPDDWIRHLRDSHNRCTTCYKTFKNAQNFNDHLDDCSGPPLREEGIARTNLEESRVDRLPPHEPKSRDEEDLEHEAQMQRLSARMKDLDTTGGSRRSRVVYDDGTYRYDDSPEQVQDGTHPQLESMAPSVHSEFELTESTPTVSEALLPVYSQLLTLKKNLFRVRNTGGVSPVRDLSPYNMKLNSIDNQRVDGKFVVNGDIPEGQDRVNELLAECFGLSHDLRVEAEDAPADTSRPSISSSVADEVDAILQDEIHYLHTDNYDDDEPENGDESSTAGSKSGYIGSSTERAEVGTHLDEGTKDALMEEVKQEVDEELRTFGLMFRHLKMDVDREIELENEDAHGGSEARDLAEDMEIDRLEFEALKDQFDKETLRERKFERAQELTYKIRSWNMMPVHEATKKIQANREKREAKKELEKLEVEHKAAVDVDGLDRKAAALEEAKTKANEAAEKGGAELAPITFIDAVGRKFSFPFHLCNTWPGMEELIKQAFLHVDVIGPHVQEGHYDLIGPTGEIILPVLWDRIIEPGWAITMTMWPLSQRHDGHGPPPPPIGIAEAAAIAKAEAEELKKTIQVETKAAINKANKKADEADKKAELAPIKFKDAVGRKFSFPFHLCNTWQGMEDLIKQAFLQVDVLGPHVQEGHYDLIGPNGEIILPVVWDKIIEPGWAITMTMWPLDKTPPHGLPPLSRPRPNIPGMRMPPPLPGWKGGIPPPPRGPPGTSPNIKIVNAAPQQKKKSSSSSSMQNSSMLKFLSGNAPAKKKGPKRKSDKGDPGSPISRPDNGSEGDAENSEAERRNAADAAVINAASKKLDKIRDEFRLKWLPLCLDYIDAPPKDSKKREDEYRKISEIVIQQVLLKLDDIETEGIQEIRQRRKELVRETHEVLKQLDAAKTSSEVEGEDTTEISRKEEEEEEADESERAARVQLQELAQVNADFWPSRPKKPMDKAEETRQDADMNVEDVARLNARDRPLETDGKVDVEEVAVREAEALAAAAAAAGTRSGTGTGTGAGTNDSGFEIISTRRSGRIVPE